MLLLLGRHFCNAESNKRRKMVQTDKGKSGKVTCGFYQEYD